MLGHVIESAKPSPEESENVREFAEKDGLRRSFPLPKSGCQSRMGYDSSTRVRILPDDQKRSASDLIPFRESVEYSGWVGGKIKNENDVSDR